MISGSVCVLTGDIVRSTRLDSDELGKLMNGLAACAEEILEWDKTPAPPWQRYRGDGWQMVLTETRFALRAGLLLRAAVKEFNEDADTRISFGFGTAEFGATLADSGGAAFERSGMSLEKMKGQDRWSVDGQIDSKPLLFLVQGLFAACEGLSSTWTSKQAEVFGHAATPDEPRYSQIAKTLNVRPQTVQDHFAKAGGKSLLPAIHRFEQALKK